MEIPPIERAPRSGVAIRPRFAGFINRLNRLRRNILPNVQYRRGDDTVRLIDNAPRGTARPFVPMRRRVVRFLQRHNRKLAIAGGALALGGALAGGLASGLSKKEAKKEVVMQESHGGTLARIVKGAPTYVGGGGGGGGEVVVCLHLFMKVINEPANVVLH